MIFSRLPAISLFTSIILIFSACGGISNNNNAFSGSDMYNFAEPKVIKLPEELDEISGIAYYARDTSVFAIVDEDGILYKIPLKHPNRIRQWKFDKSRDFEDIVLIDSSFFLLVSNGDIESVIFNGDSIKTSKAKFSDFTKTSNEFESLYINADSNEIILLCKSCDGDSKKTISRFSYHYNDSVPFFKSILSVDMAPVAEKLGVNKHLKASAAAVNPVTKDLYILSSIQKLIVIYNNRGEFKELYKLNPAIYKQPEGIAFTPDGDLIISNEFGETGLATLLLMKNKKKGT